MDIYSNIDMHDNSILNCASLSIGGSKYAKAYQVAQSNLLNGGLIKVQLAPTFALNTIGASILNSVVTLPAGAYTLALSVVGQSTANNIEVKLGYKVNNSVQSVYTVSYIAKKNRTYSLFIMDVLSVPASAMVEFYVQRVSGRGNFYTAHNAGILQLLKVGG